MKTNTKKNKTVFVGVSGGVDSSVSLALLKEQGYSVAGVFIRTWSPEFIECTWRDERRDAMRVCAHLDVPFLECDAEEVYKKGVADYMISEYKKGRTPNPDVMCNREVKFGAFWDFAKSHGADFIATGHYAEVLHSHSFSQSSLSLPSLEELGRAPTPVASQELCELRKSPDKSKDQSYFLWTLTQEDLAHTLFPIGHLHKDEVRKLAKKYDIPVAEKKDSQGVCFLGPLDMKDFLKHYIEPKRGDVLNEKGEVIGFHDGAMFLTLGERHGFTVALNKNTDNNPMYVISKNVEDNTITVSPNPKAQEKNGDLNVVTCEKVNWISGVPNEGRKYDTQIRYHGELFQCKIKILENNSALVTFDDPILVDSGQSIVFFDGDICLGGGIVK